jgi:hypothetical protein
MSDGDGTGRPRGYDDPAFGLAGLVIALRTQLSDMYLASVPIWLHLGIFKPLAALARDPRLP